MNPLTGKLRFRLRTLVNALGGGCIFVLCAIFFTQFPHAWIADIILIAILGCLYFYVWEKRAIWIRCPHCGKAIATNTPWQCGFCKQNNQHIDEHPFVQRCEHCGAEPKAYQCHHSGCGKLIFLTEDQLELNYAKCAQPSSLEFQEDELTVEARERRVKEHEIAMVELDDKLESAKRRRESYKKKSPREAVQADLEQARANVMTAHEIAREEKAANAEKYQDDPEMRKKADAFIDDWLKRRI